MNCRSFHRRMAELLDVSSDPTKTADLLEHAATCSECGRELHEARAVMARLTPTQRLHASSQVKEQIMNRVDNLNTAETAVANRRPGYIRLIRAGALAVILLLAIFVASKFTDRGKHNEVPAFTTLAQAAEFVQEARTMHISAMMRTIPSDNFDYIDPNTPMIPVEMWVQLGDKPRARLEKQGRCIVFDSKSTTMLIKSDAGTFAVRKSGYATGMAGFLIPLLDPKALFEHERQAAEDEKASVTITNGTYAVDGRNIGKKTILTIDAKAQGDFSESDYARNKSILESDNRRVYVFDPEASMCESVQVFVRTDHGDVLVFKTTKIKYDVPIKASLLHLRVPRSATWISEPSEMGVKDNSSMQPEEVAREFFSSLNQSDWQKTRQFAGSIFDNPKLQEMFGGLKVISIGKPFKSGSYPGWFVPYEIQFKSGEVIKQNLAIRNDNPKQQWSIDGGL